MKEIVHFKIEGEFLTETFRNYYWNGEHTYEEAVEYVVQFFVLPSDKDKKYVREQIAPGILKGTHKLTGNDAPYNLEEDTAEEEYHKSVAYRKETQVQREVARLEQDAPLIAERYSSEKDKKRPLIYIKIWDYASTNDPYGKNYWAIPDEDIASEYGLIAPNGDWYSCDFAMHEDLATHLVERDTNMRLAVLNKYECKYQSVRDYALDYLQSIGWLVVRNPFIGGATYPDFRNSKYTNEDDLPQAMLDTLYDWRLKRRAEN